jgi:hypothetical protein
MYSSITNDLLVVNQLESFFNTNKARYHFLKNVKRKGKYIEQEQGVHPLSNQQMNNLLDNYIRMALYFRDNKDWERRQMAYAYEKEVGALLDKASVQYLDEKELRKVNNERQRNGDKSLPTPDFLLVEGTRFLVGNRPIIAHWIECKSYYGTTIPKLKKKLGFQKAGIKYHNYFGPGIIVFKYGFNKDLIEPSGVLYAQTAQLKVLIF